MASFTSFVGILNTWLVEPVGYGFKCNGNCRVYRVVNTDVGLRYNSASSKDTKQHKTNELDELVLEDIVSCNKR